MKNLISKIIRLFDGISTRPNFTSWVWKGNISPMAFVLLHLVYVSRICSLLQILKYTYRNISRHASTDKSSKRGNVPSYFVEVYFVAWAIILVVMPKNCIITWWMSIYFLFESMFWLLYYFFFRRFFEEKYAIMHTLEYIVILPLLIFVQTRCISIINHCSMHNAFATMFFPEKTDNTYIIFLSVFYTALIFGIFLSNLPIEKVKEKGDYKFNFSIMGNGKIVQNRLKPAIATLAHPTSVAIFDLTPVKNRVENTGLAKFVYYKISDNALKNVLSSNILWIATPSYAHVTYLNKYIGNLFVAIEKPLVTNYSELSLIRKLKNSRLWKNVFCLSYYYLEKSLPLTYLYCPSTFYEKYLEFDGRNRQEILSLFEKLGALKSIHLTLFEGEDERDWVDSPQYGGHLFETFLHLAVIARMATGIASDWGTPVWTVEHLNNHYMTNIRCLGSTKEKILYDLEMRKYVEERDLRRNGKLQFENGLILVDFDKQNICAYKDKSQQQILFKINVRDKYTQTKYSIQVDMVERCFEENIEPYVIDGSDIQIDTIEWLLKQKNIY